MGEVYRAEDADLARIVAVKLLSGRFADNDAIRGRFTREALAVARLSHAPSTVTIFDVGEHDGRPYIVMEYLPGGSLADRLQREGAQPIGRSLEWLGQAAAALDAAHAQRDRPSRRQAGEPLARQRRSRQGRRLRRRERGRPRLLHRGRHGRRHGRIPRARAGSRRTGHAGERPLRARGRRLRAPDRQAPVRARVVDRGGDRARERADPARLGLESAPAAGARRRARARSREGAGAPLRIGRRVRRTRCARRSTGLPERPASARSPRLRRHANAAACRCCSCSSAARCSPASSPRRSSPAATAARPPARPRRGPSRRRSRCRGRPSSRP